MFEASLIGESNNYRSAAAAVLYIYTVLYDTQF